MREEELFLHEKVGGETEKSAPGKQSRKREYAYKGGLLALSMITAASLYQNNKLKQEKELLESETEYLAKELSQYLEDRDSKLTVVEKNLEFLPAKERDITIHFKYVNDKCDRMTVRTKAGKFFGNPGEFLVGLTYDEFHKYVNHEPFIIYVTEEMKNKRGFYSEADSYGMIFK